MAYRPHIVAQWGGRLGGTNSPEIWSNTLRIVGTSTNQQDLQDLADTWYEEFLSALNTLMQTGGYSTKARLDYLKLNAVNADGHQLPGATSARYAPADFPYGNGNIAQGAPQVALCVSFTTQAERGIAARGRVYVPSADTASGYFDPDTLQVPVGHAEAVRNAWVTFLEDIADNPGIDVANLRAAVVSPLGSDPGNWHTINVVRVGRVLDTQRRRRNALKEAYTPTAPVDYA